MTEEQKTMGGSPCFTPKTAKGPCWLSRKTDLTKGVIYQSHFDSFDDAVDFGGCVENVIEGEEVYYRTETPFDLEEFRKRCKENEYETNGWD